MAEEGAAVFVVDGDPAIRDSLRFALTSEGFVVQAFADGAALLADPSLALAWCLVLDDRMAGMDSFRLLDHLARKNLWIPVILMTAHATDGLRRSAAAAGVRYVIEKPLLGGALMESIRAIRRAT